MKRNVIIVTDGDKSAKEAIEIAAKNIGGRCISSSAGNPTLIKGTELIDLIKSAAYDPVVVMVDDKGKPGYGKGEKLIRALSEESDVDIIGAIAVASNTYGDNGIKVDCSVMSNGEIVNHPVDKYGARVFTDKIYGDTIGIIKKLNIPVVVGLGDPGKMQFHDDIKNGAPVTTKALNEIMKRSKNEPN